MGTVNPYRPLSPVGSPEFPIEPRASSLPAPRAPTLPGGGPHTSPRAAMDFLTEHAREGAVPQLIAGGALKAAGSVKRDEALQVAPLVREQQQQQALREQQLNAMLQQIGSLQRGMAPEAIAAPAAPQMEGFQEWVARRYPQLRGRILVPVGTTAALRKLYMEEQAAKVQNYRTQGQIYGAQMRGRRAPGSTAALMGQMKGYFPPPATPETFEAGDIREEAIYRGDPGVLKRLRQDQLRTHARKLETIAAEKPAPARPKDLIEGLTRAIDAGDTAKADRYVRRIAEMPAKKRLSTKPLEQGLREAIERGDTPKVQQYTGALLGIAAAGVKKGLPADIDLASKTLEFLSRLPFGIPEEAKPAFGTALEKVQGAMQGGPGASPMPLAPTPPSAPAPVPSQPPPIPTGPPSGRVDEMTEWYWSLSPDDRRRFSAGIIKGAGGQ